MSSAEETKVHVPTGFGDAISGLLARKLDAKEPILALSKKRTGDVDEKLEEAKRRRVRLDRRDTKALRLREHVVPDITTDRALEQQLVRIATRGVVSLFNAVAKQQKVNSRENEESEKKKKSRRKEVTNMSKESFLEMLKNGSAIDAEKQKAGEEKPSTWSVLSDNFDHDKDEDSSEEREIEQEIECDGSDDELFWD